MLVAPFASTTITAEQGGRLRAAMEKSFPEATITGHEPLTAGLANDAKDRHVVAAALKAGAQVIVTMNLRDFQPLPDGLEAQSPDEFLSNLLDLDPDGIVALLREQAASLKRPHRSFEEIVAALGKMVPEFAAAVSRHTSGAAG